MPKHRTKTYDGRNIFFTSDSHFFHGAIIAFANRPFKDVNDMTMELIRLWNEKVPEDADVFHLGDFAFTGHVSAIAWIISQLNGRIHLVLGNHCYQNGFDRDCISSLFESTHLGEVVINVTDPLADNGVQKIILNHRPLKSNSYPSNFIHLHGHMHEKNSRMVANRLCVCVEQTNYKPVSYSWIASQRRVLKRLCINN